VQNTVLNEFLSDAMEEGIQLKVFIEGASPSHSKTMLSGKISAFDNEAIVLDECLIFLERVISITPYH